MKYSTLFRRAAQRLREKGWQQGARGEGNGPNCVRGALECEAADTSGEWAAIDALDGFLCDWSVHWNDAPGRTAEEVIATLEDLAEELRLGGE